MISIHVWVSLRWPSLVLNVGIAIVALVVSLSLVESDLRAYYPWFIPVEITNDFLKQLIELKKLEISKETLPSLLTSVIGGTVVCVTAVLMLRRRDVY
jgi:hypothetical protein